MAIQVDVDVIEESALSETRDGYRKVRVYRVRGLTGEDDSRREYDAMIHASIPSIGAPHPSIPGIRATQRDAVGRGPDFVDLRVTYASPRRNIVQSVGEPPYFEIGGTTERTTTNEDINGDPLRVSYRPNPNAPDSDTNPEATQTGTLSFQKPRLYFRLTRQEDKTPEEVSDVAAAYIGHTNSATFAGKAAGTLLMGPIIARGQSGESPTEVSYEVFYDRDDWRGTFAFVDKETNRIPENATIGNGIARAVVYPSADFNQLGLL